jgi:hypothetical protein
MSDYQKSNEKRGPALSMEKTRSVVIVVMLLAAWIISTPLQGFMFESAAIIRNCSGTGVAFDQVTLNGQIVWKGTRTIIEADVTPQKLHTFTPRGAIMVQFRGPKEIVKLELISINEMSESETLRCELDNRSRPCIFELRYFKGKLECGKCEDYMD